MKYFTKGQTFIALVIFIGSIVLAVGVALAIATYSFIDSTFGYQASEQAQAFATAGVEDALLQLDRNNVFSSSGYVLSVASGTALVAVTQNSPSAGLVTILSSANVSGRTKKLDVVVSENGSTDQPSIVSWNEVQ